MGLVRTTGLGVALSAAYGTLCARRAGEKMRIKAYLAKQHFLLAKHDSVELVHLVSAVRSEQILLQKAFLLPFAMRGAQFDDFKIMWPIYEVAFASVCLSCSQNDIRINLDSRYLMGSRTKTYVLVDSSKCFEGKRFASCEMPFCWPFFILAHMSCALQGIPWCPGQIPGEGLCSCSDSGISDIATRELEGTCVPFELGVGIDKECFRLSSIS